MISIPSVSKEYLYVPDVKAFRDGNEADPTTLTVDFAFMRPGAEPVSGVGGDWLAGEWQSGATTPTARYLITGMSAGTYDVWLRVNGISEAPARPVGKLVIT